MESKQQGWSIMKQAGVLLVYLEPTPYILGLIAEIRSRWSGLVQVLFVKENLSQNWALVLPKEGVALLATSGSAVTSELRRHINSKKYDIVHLAGWGQPTLMKGLLLAYAAKVPVTIESDTSMPFGQAVGIRIFKRVLYPLLFKLPAFFFPGGSRQANYLRHYGVGDERLRVAKMTVDVSGISRHVAEIGKAARDVLRSRLALRVGSVVFLYVGRLEVHKGLQDLVSAFTELRATRQQDCKLLLVGDGSMRENLSKISGGDSQIICTGRLAGSALLDAYAMADVFVLPSRFEPWGLVVNEAMAAGLPVIATDRVGCTDDLVIEGVTGQVVPAEDVQALTVAMRQLLENDELRSAMARNSRALIAEWTLAHEAEIVVNTWRQLLEGPCLN
jgi:glycosyltransferase involved in cell wall biosynthesis